MIELDYKLNEKVGFSHVIDLLGTCSPYGTERKKKLRVYDNLCDETATAEFYTIALLEALWIDLSRERLRKPIKIVF